MAPNGQNNDGNHGGPWGPPRDPSPWGKPPQRRRDPNLDKAYRQFNAFLNGLFPNGLKGTGLLLITATLAALWFSSGFYTLAPSERAAELVFGKSADAPALPGLNWNWPAPVGSVRKASVTLQRNIVIGETTASALNESPDDSSLMLTADENIIDVDFSVFWSVENTDDGIMNFLFKSDNPEGLIRLAAESAMRARIGRTPILPALGDARDAIEQDVTAELKELVKPYGIVIEKINLKKSRAPEPVSKAFIDVQNARTDSEKAINLAQAYANKIVPEAEGNALRITQEAEAYRQQVTARASGDAQRFDALYQSYKLAPEVTRKRLYLETLEDIVKNSQRMILPADAAKNIVPYLPLSGLQPAKPPVVLPDSSNSQSQTQSQDNTP